MFVFKIAHLSTGQTKCVVKVPAKAVHLVLVHPLGGHKQTVGRAIQECGATPVTHWPTKLHVWAGYDTVQQAPRVYLTQQTLTHTLVCLNQTNACAKLTGLSTDISCSGLRPLVCVLIAQNCLARLLGWELPSSITLIQTRQIWCQAGWGMTYRRESWGAVQGSTWHLWAGIPCAIYLTQHGEAVSVSSIKDAAWVTLDHSYITINIEILRRWHQVGVLHRSGRRADLG